MSKKEFILNCSKNFIQESSETIIYSNKNVYEAYKTGNIEIIHSIKDKNGWHIMDVKIIDDIEFMIYKDNQQLGWCKIKDKKDDKGRIILDEDSVERLLSILIESYPDLSKDILESI